MFARVVIGANFGDEGKGLMTDYLSTANTLVVRFNGGAQAGHTVVDPNGTRHVFSHVGSGSLRGAATYLSEYFVHNPILFFKELDLLEKINVFPKVFAHPQGIITTPYDMMINQVVEAKRGSSRHGSCGVGFNEAIQRTEAGFELRICHLENINSVREILRSIITSWVPVRLEQLGIEDQLSSMDMLNSDIVLENFLADLQAFLSIISIRGHDIAKDYSSIVFEGAQGLLLDEDHRWFPHVTHSHTGLRNVVELAPRMGITALGVNYMTRCYLTRHGAGPLPHELPSVPYEKVEDQTNIPNDYQGSLRFAWMNLDLLEESIAEDLRHGENFHGEIYPTVVVTCMDQCDAILTTIRGGEEVQYVPRTFAAVMKDRFGDVRYSFGPTRDTVR